VNPPLPGVAVERAFAMLDDAADQVRRHADIDRAVVAVGKDIDLGCPLDHRRLKNAARWTPAQGRGDGIGAEVVALSRQGMRRGTVDPGTGAWMTGGWGERGPSSFVTPAPVPGSTLQQAMPPAAPAPHLQTHFPTRTISVNYPGSIP
jgi:hypothetical protein